MRKIAAEKSTADEIEELQRKFNAKIQPMWYVLKHKILPQLEQQLLRCLDAEIKESE